MNAIVQGSFEWFEARCGKVTASRVRDAVARTAKGWGAPRAEYMAELVAERLTGKPAKHFVSPAMEWGTMQEAAAVEAYEFLTDADEIAAASFVPHPTIEMSGASPDRLIGDDGLLEVKCPTTRTHIETLLAQAVPPEHLPQIQWQLACTGRAWCDFVSFDPRMPVHLQVFVQRVPADQDAIEKLEGDVRLFLAELAERSAHLTALYGAEAEPRHAP